MSWHEDGACVGSDPEIFFPSSGEATAPAKAICATCHYRTECLQEALERGERFGIWGGLSTRERQRLKVRAGQHGPKPSPIPHGTAPGYRRCVVRPEGACASCKDAHTRYRNPDTTSEPLVGVGDPNTLARRLRAVS